MFPWKVLSLGSWYTDGVIIDVKIPAVLIALDAYFIWLYLLKQLSCDRDLRYDHGVKT